MARVVVVGGGFAGLAVAARLGRGRHQVVLCERAAELGGSMRDHRPGAATADSPAGPGAGVVGGGSSSPVTFTMPAVLRDLFRKTGKPIDDVLEIAPTDPARRYVFADGTAIDLPSGNRAATIAAFDAALGPGTGAEWEALLLRGRKMWEVLRRDVVEAPLDGARDLVRALAHRRVVATVQPWRSLASLGRATLSDVRARQLLDAYAAAAGGDPARAPASLAVLPYLEHSFGVWHVVGGPNRLIAALAERAALRGVQLRTGADVELIRTAAGRVTGVQLAGGEQLDADIVVVAIDVRAASALVAPGPPPWPASRHRAAGMSRLTVVLDEQPTGGAESDPATAAARQPGVDLPGVGQSGVGQSGVGPASAGRPAAGPTETVYLSAGAAPISTVRSSSGGPARWTVSMLVPADVGRTAEWRRPDARLERARGLLDVLAARGLDLRTLPVSMVETPADLEDRTGAPGGAVLGPPPHGLRGALVRAPNRSRVAGLFAVGASAHPGAGLPFVGLSAALVNDLIGAAPRATPPPRSTAPA